MKTKNKKQFGFSLAEILICMIMIGIIASIVTPVLYSETGDKMNRVKLKKLFVDIDSARQRMREDSLLPFTHEPAAGAGWVDYLEIKTVCSDASGDSPACWHAANDWYSMCDDAQGARQWHGYVLMDGSYMAYSSAVPVTSANEGFIGTNGIVYLIDVNGANGPNKSGYDIFLIAVYGDTVLPAGGTPGNIWSGSAQCNPACSSPANSIADGWSCSNLIMKGIDY